ncbi:MAG TPA: hypothetical protein VGN35_03760 [Jatrophihabitantaceae bacterium]|jgi:hypothetical protein|nr:hypothetical protein [Jatrophihabitantaceae bacterium]
MIRRRTVLALLASVATAVTLAAAPQSTGAATSAPATSAGSGATSSPLNIQYLGQSNVTALAKLAHQASVSSAAGPSERHAAVRTANPTHGISAQAAAQLGNPTPLPVDANGAAQAFDGIDHADSRLADNGNAFSGEPPDGDICAGKDAEVEILNSALQFFNTQGGLLTPPIANNQFMGLPPEIDRSNFTFPGPANSDINCTYDSTTNRFFLVTWGLDQDPTTGALTGTQAYYIAAQATQNPLGAYNLFKLPLESPTQPDCAGFCEADYPQSGTDANSYFLTYNRFAQGGTVFRGGRIVVLSKSSLIAGTLGQALLINPGPIGGSLTGPYLGAQVVPGSPELTANNGTHYFVTELDPNGTGDTNVGLVSLTNTAAINTSSPQDIHVHSAVVPGVLTYAIPPKLAQKAGPRPLGTNLAALVPGAPNEPLRKLDGGDDRPQPTKFANGQIWTLIDTKLATGRAGLLWLAIQPTFAAGSVSGVVTHQGYLGVATNNLAYGDIAVTPDGSNALVVSSLVGPSTYPSAVYTTFATSSQPSVLHEYLAGVRPEDGLSCYDAFGAGNSTRGCRWGDYSMANISPSGVYWFETEYITPRARTAAANWGTAIGKLHS